MHTLTDAEIIATKTKYMEPPSSKILKWQPGVTLLINKIGEQVYQAASLFPQIDLFKRKIKVFQIAYNINKSWLDPL